MALYPSPELFPAAFLYPGEEALPRVAATAAVVPKLRIPLEFTSSGFRVVEQNDDDEIVGNVHTIIATERGTAVDDPDFGVEDPTFDQAPIDLDEWVSQAQRYEPRATVEAVQTVLDEGGLAIEVGVST